MEKVRVCSVYWIAQNRYEFDVRYVVLDSIRGLLAVQVKRRSLSNSLLISNSGKERTIGFQVSNALVILRPVKLFVFAFNCKEQWLFYRTHENLRMSFKFFMESRRAGSRRSYNKKVRHFHYVIL